MPLQRQTAKKVRIVDLVSGEWVKKEGMDPSYVVTPGKESVARARISGTIVSKFVSEDGNFASLTIDDSTATIQAKLWRETGLLKDANVGDIINLIGKVREYEGDIYVVPEVLRKIDPSREMLFRLEILAALRKRSEGGEEKSEGVPEKTDEDQIRKNVLSIIESSKEGIKYGTLLEKAAAPEEAVENIINELLGEGICYEPTPGKIKKI